MQYVGKVFSTVSQLYKELNPATLSGAIDVVVVEDKDGNLSCSPFHVRFGKLQLLRPSDKAVQVIVNDTPADFYMKVSDSGEGFFVLETENEVPSQFATSPVASPSLSFKHGEDPDFLDLSGNTGAVNDLNKDGYVSAPSAQESDAESVPEFGQERPNHLGQSRSTSGSPSLNKHGFDDANANDNANGTTRITKPSTALGGDMAIPSYRPSERIIHQLNPPDALQITKPNSSDRSADLRGYSSASDDTLLGIRGHQRSQSNTNSSSLHSGASLLDKEQWDLPNRSSRHRRRPTSIASDSAYELDSFSAYKAAHTSHKVSPRMPFSHSRRNLDARSEDGHRDDQPQLHSEWDWGVKPSSRKRSLVEATHGDRDTAAPGNEDVDDKLVVDGKVDTNDCKLNTHKLDLAALLSSACSAAHGQSTGPEHRAPVLEVSLCGVDALQTAADNVYQQRVFENACVQAQTFSADPIGVLTNPNLVFRLPSSEYVQGEALILALISQLSFGQPLEQCLRRQQNYSDGSTSMPVVTMPMLTQQSNQIRISGSSMFKSGLGTSSQPGSTNPSATTDLEPNASPKLSDSAASLDGNNQAHMAAGSGSNATKSADPAFSSSLDSTTAAIKPEGRRWWRWGQRAAASTALPTTQASPVDAVAAKNTQPPKNEDEAGYLNSDSVTINMPPIGETRDIFAGSGAEGVSSGDEGGVGYMSDDGVLAHPLMKRQQAPSHMRYAKTLRLTSEQLKSLNLQRGANDIKFLVPSNKAYCEAKVYMYKYDTQIVISDIDGTITKSDALGHLFNMVGKDWTHQGVAKLYTDISNNGYEILYLTSRAIGQADGTRYFLNNVKQGNYKLPSGPLLLSPDRLFTSFHREVIMRRPQEFKMACLRDIKNLFGENSPFYAGFGNRITDAMSYRSVNVPVSRICTIDTYGEIKLDLLPGYKSSYVKMNDLVDMMFPALSSKLDPKYNDWEYWKPSMPEIDDELAEIDAMLELEASNASNKSKNKRPGDQGQPSPARPTPLANAASSPPYALAPSDFYRKDTNSASPTRRLKSPPLQAGYQPQVQALKAAISSPTYNTRKRADSWANASYSPRNPSTQESSSISNRSPDASISDQGTTALESADNESGARTNLLRKASSALSPFNIMRGSSPPSKSSLKYDYSQGSIAKNTDSKLAKSTQGTLVLSDDTEHPGALHEHQIIAPAFDVSKLSSYDQDRNKGVSGEFDEEGELGDNAYDVSMADDPAVAEAASRLVPQIPLRRTKAQITRADSTLGDLSASRASMHSAAFSNDADYSDYSDDNDVDTDIDNEDDDMDEDDEIIDQEMLDIMHDMEQVQRL
ncbi:lipin Ned1 [Coemansia sp. Benny D115]|nr:lipin Ned1 [Coemansia sp. Benny D115]